MTPPFGARQLRWATARAVTRLARALGPDAIIERYYNFGGEGMTAAHATGAIGVLEVNAPVIDHAGSRKALLDKALIAEPMRRWRERICRMAELVVVAARGHPAAGHCPRAHPRARVGRRHRPVPPGRGGRASIPQPVGHARGLRRRVPQLARRRSPGPRDPRAACRRPHRSLRSPDRRRARAAARACRGSGVGRHRLHRRHPARRDAGASRRGGHRRGAVRRRRPPAAVARVLLVAAQDLRVHGERAAGGRARESIASRRWCGTSVEGLLYAPADRGGLAAALTRLTDPALRAGSVPPRAPVPSLRLQLVGALPRARGRHRGGPPAASPARAMKVLLATDAFPPVSGGSGWSTHALARGLRARGHDVLVVRPRPGEPRQIREASFDGFRVLEIGAPAPHVPYLRNYFKNERLYASLADCPGVAHRQGADRHRPRAARPDLPARDQTPRIAPASPRCAPCATTGRCATGPT